MSGYFANEQERAEYIKGMREFLDYLEAHPEVPTSRSERIQLSTYGTREESVETVEQFAKLTDAETRWAGPENRVGSHLYATRRFGPISFFCVAVLKAKPRTPKAGDPR